jgi:TamB, inner membrane protein subunit of TAM complex
MARRLHKGLRSAGALLLGLLALVVLALGAVTALLVVPSLRARAVAFGLRELESATGYHLELALARLDGTGLVIRDVRVWDRARALSGAAGSVELDYTLGRLLASAPHVDALRIRDVHVTLPPSLWESGEEEPPAAESSGGLPSFSVGSVDVRGVRVHTVLAARVLDADVSLLRGALRSREGLRVELAEAALSVRGEQGLLLVLERAHGHFDEARDLDVTLGGALLGAAFSLRAQGESVFDRVPDGSATLRVQGLDGASLARLGLDPALLRQPVSLTLGARGEEGRTSAELTLAADALELGLTATLADELLHADLSAAGKALDRLSSALPAADVSARLVGDLNLAHAPYALSLSTREVHYGGSPIPDLDARAELALPEIRLLSLTAPAYKKALALSGRYRVDSGAADGLLALDGLALAALAPGLGGKLHGKATLALAGEELRAVASVSALDVQAGSVRVPELVLDASALGRPSAPVLTASARAPLLEAAGLRLEGVLLDVRGDGRDLDGTLSLHGAHGRADATLAVRVGRELSELAVEADGQLGERRLRGQLRVAQNTRTRDARLVLVGDGDERVELTLAELPKELSAQLTSTPIALAPWLAELGVFGVTGDLSLGLRAHLPRRRGQLAPGEARVDGHVTLDGEAADLGVYVPALRHVAADGRAELAVSGDLVDPHLGLVLVARGERDGAVRTSSDSLRLVLNAEREATALELTLRDPRGELLRFTARSPLGPYAVRDAVAAAALPPVESKLSLAERRLDQQTGLIASLLHTYAGSLPLGVSGKAEIALREEALSGALDLDVTLFGSSLDTSCAAGADTRLTLHASGEGGSLSVLLDGKGYRGGELAVRMSAPIRGKVWLPDPQGDEALALGPLRVKATGRALFLPGFPGFCALADGRADFSADVQGLFGEPITGKMAGEVRGLKAGEGEPVDVRFSAGFDRTRARAEASLLARNQQVGTLRAELPLAGETVPTGLDSSAPVDVSLTLKRVPLGALLSVGDALGQPSGHLDADLQLRGTLDEPDPRGKIRFDDVAISIASLAQPFQHIQGELTFEGQKLLIKGLETRDRDGRLAIEGWLGVDKQRRAFADVWLKSDEFPLRRQGREAGELTLAARLRIAGSPLNALDAKLTLGGGRLWLGDTSGGDVQPLGDHPDVRFEDLPADDTPGKLPEASPSVALARLSVTSEKDLWVMHKDFSVQLGLTLALVSVDDAPTLKGEAQIRRGSLMLLGRAFEIEKGRVLFTGDSPPNPELDLKATYAPPAGQKLVVTVSGRSSEPTVAFSGAATTAADALAVVSGVSRTRSSGAAEAQAQQDARGFATGLTAGLLSATVRRELGDWVPLISVENDSAGRVSSARAGVDATKLIPKFMRGFARGAYLEGVVGNSQTRPGGGVGLGVRLELTLPKDFMTSAGYGPGPNWSTDFAWAP